MSNSFGTILKVSTFGESHGNGIGAILDGCPPGIYVNRDNIQKQLDRRAPGRSNIFTKRYEMDKVLIFSGLKNNITIGSPIGLYVENDNYIKSDYIKNKDNPRPSHSDYTYFIKYGTFPLSGGGRSSARETVARVAAGSIASIFLNELFGIEIIAWVSSIGHLSVLDINYKDISFFDVDKSFVRCPDEEISLKMIDLITNIKDRNDSVGGIITCLCKKVPSGWGEPIFDKFEAKLAHAMLSIPAVKGFDIGSGFTSSSMKGSIHNDSYFNHSSKLKLKSNNSGGVQGGITTGDDILFRVFF